MSYPPSYPPPNPTDPPKRRSKPWLLIVSLLVGLLAVVLCCGGGFVTLGLAQDLANAQEHEGAHTVALDEGENLAVWAEDKGTTCSVSGPDGDVDDAGDGDQTVTWGEDSFTRVFAIDAESSGDYTISCTDSFVTGENLSMGGLFTMVAGGALCCLAVLLGSVGFVLWLMKRNKG